jgi:signal transduction histidine kinase
MPPAAPAPPGVARYRAKLLAAMMLLVSGATALALLYAQRAAAENVKRDLAREFQARLAVLHSSMEVRHAAIVERCRALARRPRIHAALEDNALDLLYPSTRDELTDVMSGPVEESGETAAYAFHARFYRFLDARGAVIPPPDSRDAGALPREEEVRLALHGLPKTPQTGYMSRRDSAGDGVIDEVFAVPIVSTETNEVIAALALGFKPVDLTARTDAGIHSGIWAEGRLQLLSLPAPAQAALAARIAQTLPAADSAENSFAVDVAGAPCLLFYKHLNPGSLFPPAYEICVYPLAESISRQRALFWQFLGAGGLLFAGAFVASNYLARRLAVPVEQLAVDSEENRTLRQRAEAALEISHEELQRSARFSADASHQLKTPVTVLRAGLEELLAGEKLAPEVREEVSGLVHQTFRLTSVIEDLLLLSRMDAGRLKLDLDALDLIPLVEGWLDDLEALPESLGLAIERDLPANLMIRGERRYTSLILQNLLENARKYNESGGRIRIAARGDGPWVRLVIGNTGPVIPPAVQGHIFERFHRGAMGENNPGHGLGLNLAHELARLHHGSLRLVRSEASWTEFEVRFQRVIPPGEALS